MNLEGNEWLLAPNLDEKRVVRERLVVVEAAPGADPAIAGDLPDSLVLAGPTGQRRYVFLAPDGAPGLLIRVRAIGEES